MVGFGAVVPSRSAPLLRNLTLDMSAAVGVGATTALVGSLLPIVARRGGLDPLGLAVLACAPFVANFLGMLAGRLGPQSPGQLAVCRASGALALGLLLITPAPPVIILAAFAFWLSYSFGLPLQLRLWSGMYPGRIRLRLLGALGTGRAAAGGVAVLAGGLLADRIGGATAVAIAGIFGAACALAVVGLRVPTPANAPGYSAAGSMRAIWTRPPLRQATIAQLFCGGGLIAAGPLYALVQVDRLNLSMGQVGVLGLLTAAATTLSYFAWGTLADRRGGPMLLALGGILGAACVLGYTFAWNASLLWVAAIAIGLSNAAIDLGLQAVMMRHAPSEDRAAVMAGLNSLTGARGIAAPFVGSILVQVGLLTVSQALFLCAVAVGIGTVLFARMGTVSTEPALRPIRRLLALHRA